MRPSRVFDWSKNMDFFRFLRICNLNIDAIVFLEILKIEFYFFNFILFSFYRLELLTDEVSCDSNFSVNFVMPYYNMDVISCYLV